MSPQNDIIPTTTQMDPEATMPAGEPLILSAIAASKPFTTSRDDIIAELPGVALVQKPLRPKKERAPVANSVDEKQIRGWAKSESQNGPKGPQGPQPPSNPLAAARVPTFTAFKGGQDSGVSIPPDTAGAVGPGHVFNPLNDNISIFDRNGAKLASLPLDDFWIAQGLQGNTFDPRVVYDPFGHKFVFVTMAGAQTPTSSLYVAVSETSDPTQSWITHDIRVDDVAQGAVWLDFPSLGFTADKITISVNLFTRSANRFAGSTVYVIDKQSLYNPPHQAAVQRFVLINQGATHAPASTFDLDVNDQYLLSRWTNNVNGSGLLAVYVINGNVATGSATISRVGFVSSNGSAWEPFPPSDLGPQLGIPDKIDVGDDRLLSVCFRNKKLYASHAVMLPIGNPSRSAVQWWKIDATNFAVDRFERIDSAEGAGCYSCPTLAVNFRDDVLVGHAVLSSTAHASAAFTFYPAGGLAQTFTVFAPGLATYSKSFSGPTNRWGDYSATQTDPLDDTSFWSVQEYAEQPKDTWGTMWVLVTLPSPLTD